VGECRWLEWRRTSRRRCVAVGVGVCVGCCCVSCFCVFSVFYSDGVSGRMRRGIVVVECRLRTGVRSRLVRWWGVMVAVAAAVGLLYGVYAVEFSTREFLSEKERSIGMLAFLFIPKVIGCTCYMMNVFRWEGGRRRQRRPSWWCCFWLESLQRFT